jgi:hypothetical protein
MFYGQLSNKADLYSFGILLFEIISGKKNQDPNQPKNIYICPYGYVNHLKFLLECHMITKLTLTIKHH